MAALAERWVKSTSSVMTRVEAPPRFQLPFSDRCPLAAEALKTTAALYGKSMSALATCRVPDREAIVAPWRAQAGTDRQNDGVAGAQASGVSQQDRSGIEAILRHHVPVPIEPDIVAPPLRTWQGCQSTPRDHAS